MAAVTATYFQRGEAIDYPVASNGTALEAGEIIVVGTKIGVCGCDIAKGETGSVHVEGVFEMPKASGAITIGAAVYWDATNKNITTTSSSNTLAGYAVAAAGADDTTVLVKINA